MSLLLSKKKIKYVLLEAILLWFMNYKRGRRFSHVTFSSSGISSTHLFLPITILIIKKVKGGLSTKLPPVNNLTWEDPIQYKLFPLHRMKGFDPLKEILLIDCPLKPFPFLESILLFLRKSFSIFNDYFCVDLLEANNRAMDRWKQGAAVRVDWRCGHSGPQFFEAPNILLSVCFKIYLVKCADSLLVSLKSYMNMHVCVIY